MGVLLVILSIAHEYTDFSKFFKYLPNFYQHSRHWQFSPFSAAAQYEIPPACRNVFPSSIPADLYGSSQEHATLDYEKSTCRPAASASFKPLLPPKRQWTRLGLNQRPPDYESINYISNQFHQINNIINFQLFTDSGFLLLSYLFSILLVFLLVILYICTNEI